MWTHSHVWNLLFVCMQANAKSLPIGRPVSTDAIEAGGEEKDAKVTVERELVSKAEEDDMEALLGTYVMGIDEAEAFSERLKRELTALEAANVHAILESEPLVEEVCLPISKHLFLCPGSSVKF
jgi:hypothetical protein